MRNLKEKIAELERRLAVEIGPRGGKIIGKTKSGKNIYETFDHPEHANFTREDHDNAADVHRAFENKSREHLEKNPNDHHHEDLAAHHKKEGVQHAQGHAMNKVFVPLPPAPPSESTKMHQPEAPKRDTSGDKTMPIPRPEQLTPNLHLIKSPHPPIPSEKKSPNLKLVKHPQPPTPRPEQLSNPRLRASSHIIRNLCNRWISDGF